MTELFPVLVAEDDPNDVFLLKRAFRNAGIRNPVYVVNDGDDAVDYLSGESRFADRDQYPLPGLLILDIKMPRRTGFEVLQWVRSTPPLRHLPVVITSSSNLEPDMQYAFSLGANAYLVKPVAIEKIVGFLNFTAQDRADTSRRVPKV